MPIESNVQTIKAINPRQLCHSFAFDKFLAITVALKYKRFSFWALRQEKLKIGGIPIPKL